MSSNRFLLAVSWPSDPVQIMEVDVDIFVELEQVIVHAGSGRRKGALVPQTAAECQFVVHTSDIPAPAGGGCTNARRSYLATLATGKAVSIL